MKPATRFRAEVALFAALVALSVVPLAGTGERGRGEVGSSMS